ncbi:phosphoribosyl-dephospho-CoA transferase [Paenibacillus sp. IHB B 3415]|uniref:malonate decarboxylase holo-ACP synthase n=1 Tax=Paenibacillus sp. IHB B 3415 TaxID=867080 RepID=UPI0005759487|nr:malonate decarboxylase holo-ACP synthase [Paenibacillus sp. IHB B 3415]KHL92957.1 phosphoribosyl-dephospho-CoA transferase [Paenibacillus sp. IHB B 3415]
MVNRTHDLIEITDLSWLSMDENQEWTAASLRRIPFVVVRRAEQLQDGGIPVGIRGAERNQRAAARLAPQGIRRSITPYEVARERLWTTLPAERQELPVLRIMDKAAELLKEWHWGPAGSAGFEMVTGYPSLKETSDLDLVIGSSGMIGRRQAEILLRELDKLGPRIDIQWEIEEGAYILRELVNGLTDSVVLRTIHGSRLVRNPWR